MTFIDKQDVINVAKDLNQVLSQKQINQVLDIYNYEEECDPSGNWRLITEHCIRQVIND